MGIRTNQMRAADAQIDWSTWVLGSALVLIALSVAHTLASFSHGLPALIGIEAAVPFAFGYAVHIVFILLAAADKQPGYIGNLIFGLVWLVLVAVMHVAVPAYSAGLLPRSLEVGVIFAALALSLSSLMAWRAVSPRRAARINT